MQYCVVTAYNNMDDLNAGRDAIVKAVAIYIMLLVFGWGGFFRSHYYRPLNCRSTYNQIDGQPC